MLNVTADAPEGSGYLTVFPCGAAQPLASNVNYVAGQTVRIRITAADAATGSLIEAGVDDVLITRQ